MKALKRNTRVTRDLEDTRREVKEACPSSLVRACVFCPLSVYRRGDCSQFVMAEIINTRTYIA